MNRISSITMLAITLSFTGHTALAQSAPENLVKIQELEAKLVAISAENAKLTELVKSILAMQVVENTYDNPLIPQAEVEATNTVSISPIIANAESISANIRSIDAIANQAYQKGDPTPIIADGGQSASTRRSSSAIGLTGNKDGGRVAISLSKSRFRSYVRGTPIPTDCTLKDGIIVLAINPCNNVPTRYRQDVTTLNFSAPVSKSGDTSFATLDGLATGTKAEVRHTFYFGDIPSTETINQNKAIKAARKLCALANSTTPEMCTTLDAKFIEKYMAPSEREAYADFIFDSTIANSYGLTFSGSVGYGEYSFFPDTQFKSKDIVRWSNSIGAGVVYFPSRGSSLLFEGKYQRTFKAADDMTRCRPTLDPGKDFLSCGRGAFEAPSMKEKFILSPQYRTQIPLSKSGLIRSVAIAPRFEYDVLSDDYALDVPIYLVSDKKEGMIAGIRLGYEVSDDEGDFKVGVFYGKTFDFTPF